MSKAFTSEETTVDSVLGRPVTRAARGQERPITLEGWKALMSEKERLEVERPTVKDEGEKARLEHRLAVVTATLESVKVFEVPPPDGRVRFGSTVELEWEEGKKQTVRLVGPDETGGTGISVESPLARALLEQKEGDEVEVTRPRGVEVATLVRVT